MGGVVAAFGVLFAIVGVVILLPMMNLQSHGRRTVGRVVRLEVEWITTDGPSWAPVAEVHVGDRTLEVRGWSTSPALYRVGEEVPIAYSASCPECTRIVSGREWLISWCFLTGGVAFALIGAAIALLLPR
jgi:hypothetical protein